MQEFQEKEFTGFVFFSAPWCAACKTVTPMVEKITAENSDCQFVKIDISKNPGLASRLGVMSLPNILIIKKGKVADQIIGAPTQKVLEEKIRKLMD